MPDSFSCRHKELFVKVWTPFRYMVINWRDGRGADSHRYRNRAEITVVICEQKPCPVWFLCQKKGTGIAWTPIWYEVLYSPRNDPDPEIIPNPEMIPKSTSKWSPFLSTSTPKWSAINPWNGIVFRHGIITSLLQRWRCWTAFNISLQFMWFFSAFAI